MAPGIMAYAAAGVRQASARFGIGKQAAAADVQVEDMAEDAVEGGEELEDEEAGDEESDEEDEEQEEEYEDEGEEDGDLRPARQRQSKNAAAWRKFYPDDSSDDSDDGNMNIDRIEDLLYLAECRLLEHEKALENFKLAPAKTTASVTNPESSRLPKPYMRSSDKIVRPDPRALITPEMRALANKDRSVDEVFSVKKVEKKPGKSLPAGLATHYNLPRTNLTPELKRDLQLLSMRALLDPKRMYKRQGKFKLPEYSQVGTIIEGPTDFFGGRISRRERQATLVDETMAAERQTGRFKRKYAELQAKQRSGKKASWNARVAKRRR